MSKYKLVPVEPTLDMLCEGTDVYGREDCAETDVLGIYKAMLDAAPSVQGDPIATIPVDGWHVRAPLHCSMDVYAAPQPAEQQPSDYPDHPGWTGSADCITAMALLERLDTDNDGRVEQIRALIGRIGADVDRLVEALEQCITSMLDSGYRADAVVIRAARAALAAYRKGGDV